MPLLRLPSPAHRTLCSWAPGLVSLGHKSMSQAVSFMSQLGWQFHAQNISSLTLDPDTVSLHQTTWAFPTLSLSSSKGTEKKTQSQSWQVCPFSLTGAVKKFERLEQIVKLQRARNPSLFLGGSSIKILKSNIKRLGDATWVMSPCNLVGQLRSMNEKLMSPSVSVCNLCRRGCAQRTRWLACHQNRTLNRTEHQNMHWTEQLWSKVLFYEVPLPATLSSQGPAQ